METWFITGGIGTLGKALVKQLLSKSIHEKNVIVYSRDEYKQFLFRQELAGHPDMAYDMKNIRFFIGDVRDLDRLQTAMKMKPDVVIHAATLKQIPSCEYNPMETIKTNINGTMNVIQAAIANKVKKVLFISSDKAVSPANLYGATKMCAERLTIDSNVLGKSPRSDTQTKLSCVRYGNVLSSRGSVIETFKEQIKKGQRITITNSEMTRFWWTIEEAVDFIKLVESYMDGGEIFIPMLKSAKVLELATTICEFLNKRGEPFISGFNEVGIRPGEKLHEVLVSPEEMKRCWRLDVCYFVAPEFNLFPFSQYAQTRTDLAMANFYSSFKSDGPIMTHDELYEKVAKIAGV